MTPALARQTDWDRANIGMSTETCKYCSGHGTRVIYKNTKRQCNCVYRSIFRACLARYRDCRETGTTFGTVSWDYCPKGRRFYSRKQEDYMADFFLVSRRSLDTEDFQIFQLFFLMGADWRFVSDRHKMARGNFFHAIYRIERTLGRVFAELKPYALYPLDEYFGGKITKASALPAESEPRQKLDVPLRVSEGLACGAHEA